MLGKIWVGLLCVALATSAFAKQHLVAIGGGKRPPAAMSRFVKWAGGEKADILVLTWSSEHEDDAEFFAYLKRDLVSFNPRSITHGVIAKDVATHRDQLLSQLASATAIFFTGGDQNLTMDTFEKDSVLFPHDSLLERVRALYQNGVVIGGTSAGTAIQSSPMLTGIADLTEINGKEVETRNGLGLLPGIILDQHFLKRQRLPRLMGLIQESPDYMGIGIDENTALFVENSRFAEVVGGTVLSITASGDPGELSIRPLRPGSIYDLESLREGGLSK